jgi:Lrp/AsnC family transcriptional regulator, regulator for asnA, asnC and gidA
VRSQYRANRSLTMDSVPQVGFSCGFHRECLAKVPFRLPQSVPVTDSGPTNPGAAEGGRNGRSTSVHLDPLSKAIIEQLQQDGRRAYATIGRAVGLSEAAVRQRVQKLIDSGVMQIVAVTDPLTVGFHRQAMIGIRCEGDLEPVADALTAMAEVDYVVMTAGSFDLLVEVVCENADHLLEIINKRIRALPQVRSTESFVYLKLRKQTYTWGAV